MNKTFEVIIAAMIPMLFAHFMGLSETAGLFGSIIAVGICATRGK